MFNLFDVVKSNKDLDYKDSLVLERGSTGTILEIYERGDRVGYNIEFVDASGKTRAVLIVNETDIEPLESDEMLNRNNVVSFTPRPPKLKPQIQRQATPYGASGRKMVVSKSGKAGVVSKTGRKAAVKPAKKASTAKPQKPPRGRSK
jgi:hypothetical protein